MVCTLALTILMKISESNPGLIFNDAIAKNLKDNEKKSSQLTEIRVCEWCMVLQRPYYYLFCFKTHFNQAMKIELIFSILYCLQMLYSIAVKDKQ